MESGAIPDTSINASSFYDERRSPHNVRLGLDNHEYWNNADKDKSPWIQVDLGSNYKLTAVKTKGNSNPGFNIWVEKIKVEFMTSNGTLAFVRDNNGQPRVFYVFFGLVCFVLFFCLFVFSIFIFIWIINVHGPIFRILVLCFIWGIITS